MAIATAWPPSVPDGGIGMSPPVDDDEDDELVPPPVAAAAAALAAASWRRCSSSISRLMSLEICASRVCSELICDSIACLRWAISPSSWWSFAVSVWRVASCVETSFLYLTIVVSSWPLAFDAFSSTETLSTRSENDDDASR